MDKSTRWLRERVTRTSWAAAGALLNLDLADQSAPITEIRSYLAAKYDARFSIDPSLFEQTVASVFRDHGFFALVTGKTGDGGIDVILERDGRRIGVQVKRYKGKIEAEQIRSLAGALCLREITEGIFVTTSAFTKGAENTAEGFLGRGIPIQLIDADGFFNALGIAQRARYTDPGEASAPYAKASLIRIEDKVEYMKPRGDDFLI